MPSSAEAEQAVIGGLFVDNRALDEVNAIVADADFYVPAHRWVFMAIQALARAGQPADEVTVTNFLREKGKLDDAGGPATISDFVLNTPTAANIVHYARIVKKKSQARQLIAFAIDLRSQAQANDDDPAGVIDSALGNLLGLAQVGRGRSLVSADEAAREAMRHIEALSKSKGVVSGIPTGLTDLDDMILGLQDGELIILAARPSMGKTALALDVATNMGNAKRPGLFVQLEMKARALAMRVIGAAGRLDGQRMRKGQLTENDWPRLARGVQELAALPIHFDDSSITGLADVRLTARRLRAQGKCDWVIIDYLQLMAATERESREREVAELSRGLKQLAGDLGIPVMALSQLNRGVEARQNKRPMMSDLRESGAIEQDADTIMFLYRDEVYDDDTQDKGVAEIIVGKQRNGPTGTVRVRYDKSTQAFDNLMRGGL